MKVSKIKVVCLCLGLSAMVVGCTDIKEEAKDVSLKETVSKEESKKDVGKENSNSKESVAPKIDENCSEVYSKEECEQFAAYTQSDAGKQEAQASKEKTIQKEVKYSGKEVYEKMQLVLEKWGGKPGTITPAPYEEGMVQKRSDGLYYIHSTYEIRGTAKGDGVYQYEMLVSDTLDLKDAYFPGSYGRFSRPMKYDEINEYYKREEEKKAIEKANETPEDREQKRKETEEQEKKRKQVMEDIYGKELIENGEVDMSKKTLGE
ncbi:hypothetical protein CN544_21800 [Bacillus toyonensis]|uniref:hypothetical protein n=1 Tax=Bacillus toyonensis TaxID=155322 RepID=UPI000BEDCB7D|nr:hypothetical protein [Bacillus toyonensis]PEF96465.1 hypothetical protein COO01_24205 [Bacillus toyonensis]PEN79263.1 hypothetical protein CN544_21800 [Bacillus toyonensis]PHC48213.1 hypothetical protein COF08_23530 [Bacillus toyonensis]